MSGLESALDDVDSLAFGGLGAKRLVSWGAYGVEVAPPRT